MSGENKEATDAAAAAHEASTPPLNNGDVTTTMEGNPLEHSYTFWFLSKKEIRALRDLCKEISYDKLLKKIGDISTVEEFWQTYSWMKRPSTYQYDIDFNLFKKGILPMWEDEANKKGGKWSIRLKKGLADLAWENLILALIGEQFIVENEITGIVLALRSREDILSVWNRTASDEQIVLRIKQTVIRVLSLPSDMRMEYKPHEAAQKDRVSYTNIQQAKVN